MLTVDTQSAEQLELSECTLSLSHAANAHVS